MKLKTVENDLCCPLCRSALEKKAELFFCKSCLAEYNEKNGQIGFLKIAVNDGAENVPLIIKIKYYLKKFPRFYEFCATVLGAPSVNVTAKKFVQGLKKNLKIINIGSGTKALRDDVINIDFQPLAGVDIVADATALPFKNNSIDAVVCVYILEHAPDSQGIMKEIFRVLKPGGLLYLKAPFMMAFHSAPDDYYRWTKSGLLKLAEDFEPLEIKVACGPSAAFVWIASEWLATLLSFNFMALYEFWLIFFTMILAPIKLLDFLIFKYKTSHIAAGGYYLIGRKK